MKENVAPRISTPGFASAVPSTMGKNRRYGSAEHKSFEVVSAIVHACSETKGKDISVLDVTEIFDISDYFVVVSGRSDRQVQGISNRIIDDLAEIGLNPVNIEGLNEGQWVLLDFGEVVVHVFYEPQREHYDIEGLWLRARKVNLNKF